MHVESSRLARVRAFEVSPRLFLSLAVAAVASLFLLVTTGAVVRLTASGLGCDNWPRCGNTPFPEKDFHAIVEFGNRALGLLPITLTLVAALAARRTPVLPRWVATLALLVFLGTIAQAPLGGLTVILDLNPLLVMSHFIVALLSLGGATVVALAAWAHVAGRADPVVPRELRLLSLVLAGSCFVLVLSGTFVTAAGPHSGGADIPRLGTPRHALWVHVPATAVFGLAFVFTLGYLAAFRRRAPRLFAAACVLLALLLAQFGVGELQYRLGLPWGLVLVHVALAAAVWAGTVALAVVFQRPPAPLVVVDIRA
jgi:cytochrome c oxidase assembly protein subunit 15